VHCIYQTADCVLTYYVGTSDEHISLLEHLAPLQSRLSSVIVTTPQAVALMDVMKCISFTRAVNLPVLGLIENMSGYVCPCCGEVSNIFSTGGGRGLAEKEGIGFLGSLPVDPELVTLLDSAQKQEENGRFRLLEEYRKTGTAGLFSAVVSGLLGQWDQGA
jgi:hypothetical protein